ncbi:hypothetical protein CVD28_00440 [Bacillus sp. M6-12]|uniref:hypothetical protein n=1 Tax=Bacillus sp. M6-12 TaxID=2054166 RepID=UPI000C77B947|nr:hypothetical protein [Bacillus sp. M6-12]PLS18903.1 hypothetical protein CVD28_00440 [Bacillus sp. M6-12]
MKKIIIQFDYSNDKSLSYMEVLRNIEIQTPIIYTNCLDFFSFSSLDKGYDVQVEKSNGDYIVLSELLQDEDNLYTRRHIRKGHDARKLLLSNEFNFKSKA